MSAGKLVACSAIAILALMAVSDFNPQGSESFGELEEGQVSVCCAIIGWEEVDEGHILRLIDEEGEILRAFIREPPPSNSTVVNVTGELVMDPEPFLFVRTLEVCE
ncbi:MAG: hypothetical protein ACLFUV_00460 [Methanomassiliicoccales archaeon]